MKILFAVVLLYSSLKAIGQQTVGQLFDNMNLLPWVAINSATSGQNGNSASTAFGFDLNKDGSDDISLSINLPLAVGPVRLRFDFIHSTDIRSGWIPITLKTFNFSPTNTT